MALRFKPVRVVEGGVVAHDAEVVTSAALHENTSVGAIVAGHFDLVSLGITPVYLLI